MKEGTILRTYQNNPISSLNLAQGILSRGAIAVVLQEENSNAGIGYYIDLDQTIIQKEEASQRHSVKFTGEISLVSDSMFTDEEARIFYCQGDLKEDSHGSFIGTVEIRSKKEDD